MLKSGLVALLPVILLSGACNHTAAQWMPSGARAMALGINGVTLTGESAGGFNQAALATLERPACFLHCANGFLLPELSFGAFCLSLPAKPGTFAFSGSYSGTSALHELQAGLLFGRSLGKIVRAGLGMHYIEMGSCAFNHSFHTIIPTFGIQVIPHKSMTLGAVVFNPANMQFTPECSRKIPVAIAAGFAYHAGDNLLVCMEFSKAYSGRRYGVPVAQAHYLAVWLCRRTISKVFFGHRVTVLRLKNRPVFDASPSAREQSCHYPIRYPVNSNPCLVYSMH